MSKKFFTAVLAAGLFSTTFTAQSAFLSISSETTGFLFENVTDLWTGAFVVDNTLGNTAVEIFTEAYRNSWTSEYSFDPFLVVWDANSNIMLDFYGNRAFSNDFSWFDQDAYINLGFLDDGIYYFTIGNWPNQLVKDTVDFNDVGASFAYYGGNPSILYGIYGVTPALGYWKIYIRGNVSTVYGMSVIPEPEAWALLLAGLAVVSLVARRRKH